MLLIGMLSDYYGAMLTVRQQDCIRMHYLEDLSLAEIAEEFQVSRQAVHDILNRAEQTLADYEAKLGLVARRTREQAVLRQILSLLATLPIISGQEQQLLAAEEAVRSLLTEEKVAD
jgi:predicted DNA-binding protein YlxM (UPF0122 family)